jgi:hypothetical protein
MLRRGASIRLITHSPPHLMTRRMGEPPTASPQVPYSKAAGVNISGLTLAGEFTRVEIGRRIGSKQVRSQPSNDGEGGAILRCPAVAIVSSLEGSTPLICITDKDIVAVRRDQPPQGNANVVGKNK